MNRFEAEIIDAGLVGSFFCLDPHRSHSNLGGTEAYASPRPFSFIPHFSGASGARKGGWMIEASGSFRDSSGAAVRPPIAWVLAAVAGLVLDWLYPLPFLPAAVPAGWLGVIVFLAGLVLLIWAAATFRRAGTQIQTTQPTTTIVEEAPYRYSRNPIYIGMFLGLIGLAVGFDSLWLLILLVPFYLVIRHGVVAREEAYLELKFGDVYCAYKTRVRRWL